MKTKHLMILPVTAIILLFLQSTYAGENKDTVHPQGQKIIDSTKTLPRVVYSGYPFGNMNQVISIGEIALYDSIRENQLVYYIRNNNTPGDIVEVDVVHKAGRFMEDSLYNGIADLTGKYVLDFYTASLKDKLPGIDIKMKGNVGEDYTAFTFLLPSGIREEQDISTLMQVLSEPVIFDGGLMNTEKQQIAKAKKLDILQYYNEWYRPDRMAILVAGNINEVHIQQLIQKKFSTLKNPVHEKHIDHGVTQGNTPLVFVMVDSASSKPDINIIWKNHVAARNNAIYLLQKAIGNIMVLMLNKKIAEFGKANKIPFSFAQYNFQPYMQYEDGFSIHLISSHMDSALQDIRLLNTFILKGNFFSQPDIDYAKTVYRNNLEKMQREKGSFTSSQYCSKYKSHFLYGETALDLGAEVKLVQDLDSKLRSSDFDEFVSLNLSDKYPVIILKISSEKEAATYKARIMDIFGQK
ncbi:MAG: peptidase [Bacteroidota bacterium]|nr:peptidase [Bacteroidota bacterium]